MSTRLRLPLALLLAVPMLMSLGVGTASAHTYLESVDPADGSTLATAPHIVRLVFSKPVDPALLTISLLDSAGELVAGTSIIADPSDPSALDLVLPAIAPSAYRIPWIVVDQLDSHITTGTIVFGIGTPAPAPVGELGAAASLPEVAIRWLALALLALAGGSLMLFAVVGRLPAHIEAQGTAILRRLIWVAIFGTGGAILSNGSLLSLRVVEAGQTGIDPAALLRTTFGAASLVVLGLLTVLFVVLLSAMRRRSPAGAPGLRLALVGSLILGLAGVQSLTGHVATGPDGETPTRWLALTVHLLAMLVWVGGLAALGLTVGPLLRGPRAARGVARAVLGRFWRLAAPALAVLAVTGLYLGGQLVASLDALLLTAYGQALMVKTALAVVAASLGALNTAALHPGVASRLRRRAPLLLRLVPSPVRLRAVITLEAALALTVVGAAAFMSASPPARGPRFEPLPASEVQSPSVARAADLLVTVIIRPDRPGPNFIDIAVLDTRRPAPAPIGTVSVRLVPPTGGSGTTLIAQQSTPGHYQIDNLAVDQAGAWQVAVEVQRAGLAAASVEFPWTVAPPFVAPRPVVISDAPLAPVATPLAIALATLLGLVAVVANIARRRWRVPLAAAMLATEPAANQQEA